jgi:predicted amidophosphoribosyltransferase
VPVPLHTGRLQQRGFNQADLLGKQLAEKLSIPYSGGVLRRTKSTRPLVGLSAQERQQEVYDAFRMAKQSLVAGTRVLLIDDVFTTGSSAGACSRELLRGGAKTVDVMVVAYRRTYRGEKQLNYQARESKVEMNGAKECTGGVWSQRCVRPQDELRTEVD